MNNKLIIGLLFLVFICVILTFMNYHDDSNNWTADKNEYPKNEYQLNELPVSHKSAYELRQFFDDSDVNNDGILKDEEINTFDYKIKHSQYTYNGPYGYN